ncbi:MAG TPA: DUF2961 domain-containing protein, partial [Chitinophagaceae bacterium]|nr:DUF2961 domain-containing protein [Chitinophagaceae bacterium]
GWSQSRFVTDYSGCLLADEKKRQFTFYRYHIPDPIFFASECRVTLQQIGATFRKDVIALQKRGAPMIPTLGDGNGYTTPLYRTGKGLDHPSVTQDFAHFYRTDDLCATAYFYLDRPEGAMPPLQPLPLRVYGLARPDY